MMANIHLENLFERLWTWAQVALWNQGTYFQLIIIIAGFVIGGILYRLIRPRVTDIIDNSSLSFRFKRVARNLTKQIFPLCTMFVISIGAVIISSKSFGIETGIADAVNKLLLAWIAIRISLQFIENNFVRNIFALTIWVIAALSIFGMLDQTANILDELGFNIGEFRLSALAVLKGTFAVFILLYAAGIISGFAERRIMKVQSLTRSSQVLISKVIHITLMAIALLIAITSAGIDLSLFAVFGGAIGLGIGFGLQKGISNLFSGMLLLMDRSIKPGDVIEILDTGTFGWVNHMAARYTEIVTRDNKSFLIPNEDFITQRVVNWSHGDNLIRLQVTFGVHYDSDPHQVKELAEIAATTPERVVSDPKPVCWLTEFGDSSLNFSLRFWIKDAEAGVTNIRGQVMMALWDAFKENDIKIPYPHREIYIHKDA